MGVPKFYRWISERYPCLSEVVKEYQVPEFDNLYLDMNGIIHVCSHPNDDNPHFRITEEQIFKDIFHYIEVLFRIVRPRKVFFMAVDGVAPRAKMNQQRGRRFRSAKEAEENIKKALKKGETLPDAKRFDSNCITPGTKFMVRLQDQLQYMVQSKISTDPSWQGISVYLSGHETPGEGEHKITEYIRHERSQPGYDPNTRHCLYGLDADLMMLGLCSHEPHFSLLREEVRFTGKRSKNSRTAMPEETTFHLLHLSLMREYIEHEFESLKGQLPFEFNLESIIDDWVLMGFLVGNDFIPHLPHLHIAHNALPMLYKTYKQVLPKLDGYLNEGGIVNLQRFEQYLETLAEFDREKFGEEFDDLRWLESKTGKKKIGAVAESKKNSEMNSFGSLEEENKREPNSNLSRIQNKAIQVVKELSVSQGLISLDSECESNGSQEESTFETEFHMFKRHYYQEKLHIDATDEEVDKLAYEYILAIQWICHYYYNGVQSWSWYYPYHYAPFLSDLRHLRQMKLHFSMETPFLPYQQLLAVLPAASKECLPEPYWDLMCSEHSPIIDYYPTEFQCDLNGKQQEWEAVVLIPFINEKRLLEAMVPYEKKLTAGEKNRNRHSSCILNVFDSNVDVFVKSCLPDTFPDIVHCKSRCNTIPLNAWNSCDTSRIVKGLLSDCRLSVYYPGFPTLYHLPHISYLKKQGVKVFQMPSKNENMILGILSPNHDGKENQLVGVTEGQSYKKGESLEDVAKNILGCSIYVNWPHLEEAKVVAVSDGNVKYEVSENLQGDGAKVSKQKMHRKTLTDSECKNFDQDVDVIEETYLSRHGIKIGTTDFVVYAQPLLGRKYVCGRQGIITLEKQWAVKPQFYALQATVKDIAVKDPTFHNYKGIDELFPVDSTVFTLGHPNYGCKGKVISVQKGMTTVELETPVEPDIESVMKKRNKLSSSYYPGWQMASRVGISGYLLSRITGTIYVFYPTTRKWQLGLNLRFSRENSGVAGYTKLENREWSYSEAVEHILKEYWGKFPEVLRYLQSALNKHESDFDATKMVKGEDVVGNLQEVSTWLKTLRCYGGDKVNENSEMLELKVVQAIDEKVQTVKNSKHESFQITVQPQDLYRPLAHQGTLLPDSHAQHKLLDRIVCVRDAYTVPLGMRGTIIGIHKLPGQDVLYDVFFDEEFMGGLKFGGRCPDRRGYRMPECTMINISYGKRLEMNSQKPMTVVKPQNKYAGQKQRYPGSPRRNDRNIRSNKDPNSPVKRPQSSQLPSAKPVNIMQRSSKSSVAKGQQNSNQHVFENLWNTLKLQNQSSNKAPTTNCAVMNANPVLATNQNEMFPPSLTQAAKTLPNIQLTSLNNNSNNAAITMSNAVEESSVPASAVATLSEPVITCNVESSKTSSETEKANTKNECNHLDQLFKSIKISKSQRLAFTPTQPCNSYQTPNHILPPFVRSPMNYFPVQQGPIPPQNMMMPPYAYPRHPHPQLLPNQWPPQFMSRPGPPPQMYRGMSNTITHSSCLPTNSTASVNLPIMSEIFNKWKADDRICSMTFTSSKMQGQNILFRG